MLRPLPTAGRGCASRRGRSLAGVVALAVVLCGCVTDIGLMDDGWTRLPPRSLEPASEPVATPDLCAESRLIDVPPPPKPEAYDDRPARPLSLAQASLLAMKSNRRIKIVSFDNRIAEQQPILADAGFDPRFGIGGSFAKTDQPAASDIEAIGPGLTLQVDSFGTPPGLPNILSIDKRLRSGGAVSANYGFTYDLVDNGGEFLNLNPAWRSTLSVTIEQPLVQGRGHEVNELGIRIARVNHKQSLHEFERTVQELLRDTHLAYWNLVYAILNESSLRRSVTAARQTRETLVTQFEVGRAHIADLAHGTLYAEGVEAELARAAGGIQEAEQQLRILLGLKSDDGMRLSPTEKPIASLFKPDWTEGVRTAFVKRPDLKSQANRVQSARLVLRQSAETLRPDIDAVASMGFTGLDDNLPEAMRELDSGDYANWSVGVRYQQSFYRRGEKATHELAELSLGREKATLNAIEQTVLNELQDAYREIHSTQEVVLHQRARVEAAAIFLESRRAMYEKGLLTLEGLLQADAFLVEAKIELLLALIEYNQAIVSWQWATGCILSKPIGTLETQPPLKGKAFDLLRDPPPPPKLDPIPEPMLPEVRLESLDERVPVIPELPPVDFDELTEDDERLDLIPGGSAAVEDEVRRAFENRDAVAERASPPSTSRPVPQPSDPFDGWERTLSDAIDVPAPATPGRLGTLPPPQRMTR